MSNAYKVREGEVKELSGKEVFDFSYACDWREECLVMADSKEEALKLAMSYDKGNIEQDNVFYPDSYGEVIIALKGVK